MILSKLWWSSTSYYGKEKLWHRYWFEVGCAGEIFIKISHSPQKRTISSVVFLHGQEKNPLIVHSLHLPTHSLVTSPVSSIFCLIILLERGRKVLDARTAFCSGDGNLPITTLKYLRWVFLGKTNLRIKSN